jgi:hypothetical protein
LFEDHADKLPRRLLPAEQGDECAMNLAIDEIALPLSVEPLRPSGCSVGPRTSQSGSIKVYLI